MLSYSRVAVAVGFTTVLLGQTVGEYVSLEYYLDSTCSEDAYGMQVTLGQCFRQVGSQGSGSAMVFCSESDGLYIEEYADSQNCSSPATQQVVVATAFSASTCITSTSSNKYFPTQGSGSVQINCDAENEWFTSDDGRYELSRETTSLEAASALDYTLDNCVENGISTEMNYCYINMAGEVCLPTNSDPDDDSFCSNSLTYYAYAGDCLTDWTNSKNVKYKSDDTKSGYFQQSCNSWDDQYNYVFPFSDCIGCNRFKDLKDDTSSIAQIVGIIIGVTIGVCCLCCCCGFAIAMCIYGSAAVCSFFCRKKKDNDGVTSDPVIATPMHQHQQQQMQNQPQYLGQYQESPPPYGNTELLQVQVAENATAGSFMWVTKSTGEQVQVRVPEGVQPGQIIQVKA